MTPNELAKELGISPKTLRAWLRRRTDRGVEKWTRWGDLDEATIQDARARWGSGGSGVATTSRPDRGPGRRSDELSSRTNGEQAVLTRPERLVCSLATLEEIRAEGFTGFDTVRALCDGGWREIPDEPGVYLVLRTSEHPQVFLPRSTGGLFKGKDPTVPMDVLSGNWVDGALVLNIGKAGGPGSGATLRKRIRQYLRFGAGEPVGHRGGRYIWQLRDAEDLLLAWKVVPDDPRAVEHAYITAFKEANGGRRPFANLVD